MGRSWLLLALSYRAGQLAFCWMLRGGGWRAEATAVGGAALTAATGVIAVTWIAVICARRRRGNEAVVRLLSAWVFFYMLLLAGCFPSSHS